MGDLGFHGDTETGQLSQTDDEDDEEEEDEDIDSINAGSRGPMEIEQKDGLQLRADDYDAMQSNCITKIEDLEILADGHYTWHIDNFRKLEKKVRSPKFNVGGHEFQILMFPFGNSATDQVSLYVEAIKPEDADDRDWYICAQFGLVMWNPQNPQLYVANNAQHRFNHTETDWGFSRFHDVRELYQKNDKLGIPLIDKEQVNITAYVRVLKDPTGVLWHNFIDYDSKRATGYVGLKNQGATCYMNSLLQSLYFTNQFRKAVYSIPTQSEKPSESVPLALQRVFYNLQTASETINTSELTRSFGWDSMDSFMQHDVQEFNRVLQDNLEQKMKGTSVDGILNKLFVGKMKSYIRCLNVDYESSREEEFWDIQLNVKGMKDLHESFQNYVLEETLTGDNKYFAEGFGLQDAKKGVTFMSFPPVLHLQLKRFEYDFQRDIMVKINDRFEFPLSIDLSEFLSKDAKRDGDYIYYLHGVLVHSGDLHGGHYYALLKPDADSEWYKFDDERVTKATQKEVLDENFGGEYTNYPMRNPYNRTMTYKRYMSAYMLVYVRGAMRQEVLAPITEAETPKHLVEVMEEERRVYEKRQQELSERHLFMNVQLVSLNTFKNHSGFDLANFDDRDPSNPRSENIVSLRIRKDTKATQFKENIAKEMGLPKEQIRFWVMVQRQNKTTRPDMPVKDNTNSTMEEIRERFTSKVSDLKLFVEVASESGVDEMQQQTLNGASMESVGNGQTEEGDANANTNTNTNTVTWPLIDPKVTDALTFVFIKCFDAQKQTLGGLFYLYVGKGDRIGSLVAMCNKYAGWPEDTPLRFFEEIKPTMIDAIKPRQTYQQSEIQNGDIICFERDITEADGVADAGYVSVTQYYDYLLNRLFVTMKPRFSDQSVAEVFNLIVSRKTKYDALINEIGTKLGVQPSHIRLWSSHYQSGNPKSAVKLNPATTVQNIIAPTYASVPSNTIFYEVLNMSLQEFELKKLVHVSWLWDGILKEELMEVFVTKGGTIKDVIHELVKGIEGEKIDPDSVRVYYVHAGKIAKILYPTQQVVGIQDSMTLYAEKIPQDEHDMDPETEALIQVFHFHKDTNRTHGIPFLFVVKKV